MADEFMVVSGMPNKIGKSFIDFSTEYSVSTNFRLELIESSAREVEGQPFLYLDAVPSLARF